MSKTAVEIVREEKASALDSFRSLGVSPGFERTKRLSDKIDLLDSLLVKFAEQGVVKKKETI